MRPLRTLLLALAALLVTPGAGADRSECATSREHNTWLRELGAWSSIRAREVAAKGLTTAEATRRGDVYVVPADVTNAPFRRPFDLEGRTLVFQRQGDDGFSMRNIALDWNPVLGARLALQSAAENHGVVVLDFDFPYYDRTVRTLFVTDNNGIHLGTPLPSELHQYGEAELATERQAVIAPLLTTRSSRLGPGAEVYLRKDADAATVTWVSPERYSVRATLHRSGEIRFSYQRVTAVAAASVLITSGSEAWRGQRASIAERADPADDLRIAVSPAVAGMVDITNVSIERVNDLDLFEVRIRTSAAIDTGSLPAGDSIQFNAVMGGQTLRFIAYADGRQRYQLPVWGWNWGSSAGRIEGDEVVMTFLREHIADFAAVPVSVWSYRNGAAVDSTASVSASIPVSQTQVRTDFSATGETVFEARPIVEAFTVPVLSVYRVWEQLKQADPSLRDEAIDGVAIYQNFYTDLVTYAGAYSTGGNPGASGLFYGDDSALFETREPALMHMNAVGYGHNRTSRGASRVVLHELGHRWLLFASLLDNGVRTRVLNPVSAHPAQYVDTRAAFRVYTDTDTSVMGGGWFTDHQDGSFSSSSYGPYGYSWLDLYLMGLADAAEVPPMFYVAESNPKLGDEYYAPPNQTYHGTRRDFTVQQVIDGTGPRRPAFPSTQRNLRVVFVLVTDPDRAPSEQDFAAVEEYRGLLETDFRIATDNRGNVSTSLTPHLVPPRRRAAPK